MTAYIVCYSLGREEKKYKSFFTVLSGMGGVKVLQSAYIVRTTHNIDEMRMALLPYLDKTDSLFIGAINGEVAVRNALCSNEVLSRLLEEDKQV